MGAGVAVSKLFRALDRTWPDDPIAGKAELDMFTFVFGFLCWYNDLATHPSVNFDRRKFDLLENFIEAALTELTYGVGDTQDYISASLKHKNQRPKHRLLLQPFFPAV